MDFILVKNLQDGTLVYRKQKQEVYVNFSMGNSLSGRSTSSESQSDRMRKAIERNRAKQARKAGTPSPSPVRNLPGSAPSSFSSNTNSISSFANRQSVARPDDTTFSTSFRSSRKKAPASVGYSTSTQRTFRSASRSSSSPYLKYLVYAGWIFCVVLLFRLIFSERGVYEYFQKKDYILGKINVIEMIAQENVDLKNEIQEIKSNKRYQKKLVRDHLGFIAKDEYLILFPKGKADPAI